MTTSTKSAASSTNHIFVTFILIASFCYNAQHHSHTNTVNAFSVSSSVTNAFSTQQQDNHQAVGNILILDHLNINHEKGRHDLLKSFYFDFLQCAVDPRKEENLVSGKKTLWANIGSQQFHLSEGNPEAQVFDGVITLAYQSLEPFLRCYPHFKEHSPLKDSLFHVMEDEHLRDEVKKHTQLLRVTDPWGNCFHLVSDSERTFADERGSQPGEKARWADVPDNDSVPTAAEVEPIAMTDLTVHVPLSTNFAGIARFYNRILGAPILYCTPDEQRCVLSVGPRQTLSFVGKEHEDGREIRHEDLRHDEEEPGEFGINLGAHVSIYVGDIRGAYRRADALGALYVNPRFKRRAYTEEEAVDQCMFRCLDIVDPQDVEAGAILRLEHEIRSVVKKDGGKYKSCPFYDIPNGCVV